MIMDNDNLTSENFTVFAAKHYKNFQCFSTNEFYDDLKRFKYIKRLFRQYQQSGEIKERLVLIHCITLNNLFGPEATVRMLFHKLGEFRSILKPFLVMLSIMPEVIKNVDGINILSADIPMDQNVVNLLRKV